MSPDVTTHLLGPQGGIFALGFAMGCALTYAFMSKVIIGQVKAAHSQEIESLRELHAKDIALMSERISTLEQTLAPYLSWQERTISKELKHDE